MAIVSRVIFKDYRILAIYPVVDYDIQTTPRCLALFAEKEKEKS
jgi:hypothetical protein